MFEKIRQNKIIRAVCAFQRTPGFIACVALISLVSHLFGLEYFGFWSIAVAAAFTLVFQEDTTPVIPCVFFLFFAISRNNGASSNADLGVISTLPFIVNCVVMGVIAIGAFVFHIVYFKCYRSFKRRTMLTAGFIALGAGLITNGFFVSGYNIMNLPVGLSFAAIYYFVYLLFFHTIKWEKGFSMRYLAFVFFAMGLLVSAQMGMLYARSEELRATFDKDLVYLGWAKSNSIAFVLLMPMTFGFYLAHTEKFSLPYYLGVCLMLVAVIFTFARGSLIIAVPLFVAGTIFNCLFAKNRLPIWITAGIAFILAVVVIVWYRDRLLQMLNFYIETGFNDRGRFELWAEAWECFKQYPLFGAGLMHRYGDRGTFLWFHNTLLHFLGTGGIVGLGTYVFHRVQTVIMFCRKPSLDRLFAGVAILAVLANGMLDVPMSMQYMLVFYSTVLAFCEKDTLFRMGKIDAGGNPIQPLPPVKSD